MSRCRVNERAQKETRGEQEPEPKPEQEQDEVEEEIEKKKGFQLGWVGLGSVCGEVMTMTDRERKRKEKRKKVGRSKPRAERPRSHHA